MELEPGNPEFSPVHDPRGTLAEPPPVRLISVADVTLLTPAGHERFLDGFYLGALKFDPFDPADPRPKTRAAISLARAHPDVPRLPGKGPEAVAPKPGARSYRAENFVLHYRLVGALQPEHLKLLQVEVPDLAETVQRLLAREIQYDRVRGLQPGLMHVQVTDPAGHIIQIFEGRDLPL